MYLEFEGMRCSPSQVGTASSSLLDESSLAASGFGRARLKETSDCTFCPCMYLSISSELQQSLDDPLVIKRGNENSSLKDDLLFQPAHLVR